jgi:2-polyprenyl-3-methyl-5-hydroxy-6-metoxy-1,4-benzoquinol methylase
MSVATTIQPFDADRFEALQGKVTSDVAGAISLYLAYIGDQTGVYAALAELGRATPAELAERAGVDERYLLEWLSCNAGAGYVEYDAASGRFWLSPEQEAIFAAEGTPTCMQGFFQALVGQYATHDKAVETFRSGAGRGWNDHHSCAFCGVDRFFRPGYEINLIDAWLPVLDGVVDKLTRGGRVADIGCGHGSATAILAQAFPEAQVYGFDFHAPSIERARRASAEAGLCNIAFSVSTAKSIEERDFDLVCIFDALHDMGDPEGAARHIAGMLKPDGTLMVVEPLAGDTLSDNLHVLGTIYYGFSTTLCTPASRAQEVGLALGAQAGEHRIAEVLRKAGFSRVRRVAETQVNMVLEARL